GRRCGDHALPVRGGWHRSPAGRLGPATSRLGVVVLLLTWLREPFHESVDGAGVLVRDGRSGGLPDRGRLPDDGLPWPGPHRERRCLAAGDNQPRGGG